VENAFKPGDPVLDLARGKGSLATSGDGEEHWIDRDEQANIDAIINGSDHGYYYVSFQTTISEIEECRAPRGKRASL